MKFNPLISIIIPVYNGANFMREAIDSALSQTYDNVEVVVVNDGSTDNTEEIAQSYGDKIRYYKKENGGVATALNMAIEKSKGEYISWLSHDDVYYPDKLATQIEFLCKLDKDKRMETILYSNYDLIDEDSHLYYSKKIQEQHNKDKLNSSLYPVFKGLVYGCSLLIPAQCFEKIGTFNVKLLVTQDYDLWFRMFPHYSVIHIPDSTVMCRQHGNQGSKTIRTGDIERNEQWINRLKSLTDDQMTSIGGSVENFFETMRSHYAKAGYKEALKYIENKIATLKRRDVSSMRVSVIIPFYNRIDWAVEAVLSVLDQTHENFEVLLIDDHSTEDISKLLSLVKTDERVSLYKNKYLRGAAGGRNTGIDFASGQYIAFLDADDLFEKDKLNRQLEFMISGNHSFSHTSYKLFGESIDDTIMDSGKKTYCFPEIISGCMMATPTVMISSQLLKKDSTLRFPEKYLIGQDVCFWIMICKITSCEGISEPLSKVRKHGTNVAYTPSKQLQGINNILDFSITNYSEYVGARKHLQLLSQKLSNKLCLDGEIKESQTGIPVRIDPKPEPDEVAPVKIHYFTKSFLRYKLKKIIWTVSPSFRLLEGSKNRISQLQSSLDLVSNKLSSDLVSNKLSSIMKSLQSFNSMSKQNFLLLIKRQDEVWVDHVTKLNKSTEEIKGEIKKIAKVSKLNEDFFCESLSQISNDYEISKNNLNISIDGSIVNSTNNLEKRVNEYHLDRPEFIREMSRYILKTDVVLDIGPGIKPQTYFTPKVHLCVEPFKQYRDVVKPFFPNNCLNIFLKADALQALQALDDDSVDSVFMLDLIEHLDKADGQLLIKEADRVSRRQIIIYTPLGFYPMHFNEDGQTDAWGLDGNDLQEHKSGWLPEDFDSTWDFHVRVDCHDAFFQEEKEIGKKYSALLAIKTKDFRGYDVMHNTPDFVKDIYKTRILE